MMDGNADNDERSKRFSDAIQELVDSGKRDGLNDYVIANELLEFAGRSQSLHIFGDVWLEYAADSIKRWQEAHKKYGEDIAVLVDEARENGLLK
jgi:hypothetical protein